MPTQYKQAAATPHFFSHACVYASITLRAIAGGGFIEHGWAKIVKGPDAFAAIL